MYQDSLDKKIARRNIRRIVLALLIASLLIMLPARELMAADVKPGFTVLSVSQENLDDEYQPDLTIIRANMFNGTNTVLVYRNGGAMKSSSDWREATNYTDNTWVFLSGDSNVAKLVIVFRREGDDQVAYMYDSQTRENYVKYRVNGGRVEIYESPFWTIKVVAKGGSWLTTNGDIHFNIKYFVDGPVTFWTNPEEIPGYQKLGLLKHDGIPDFEGEVVDDSNAGKPSYEMRRLLLSGQFQSQDSYSFGRAAIWMNTAHIKYAPYSDFVFWPFLGAVDRWGREPGDQHPPIQLDWERAKLINFSSFLVSTSPANGMHIFSIRPIHLDQVNELDFENPFGYYNLANGNDGFPDLIIRNAYFALGDYIYSNRANTPLRTVRYTWDKDHNHTLDFKLNLIGPGSVEDILTFRNFSIKSISWERMPTETLDHNWNFATFVASEGSKFWTSEGIYDWDVASQFLDYYTGGATAIPTQPYQSISQGLRGEYKANLNERPLLYLSPIDNKLHLLRAESGIWNIDGDHVIRYNNLNEDNYIDQWLYSEEEAVHQVATEMRQLDVSATHLVYSDNDEVIIRQTQVRPSLFETMPPATHDEWVRFRSVLDASTVNFAPGDFKAIVQQFVGPEMQITGGTLRDYRPISGKGFRFVLNLTPSFHVYGDDLLNISRLAPGEYAVTYNGQFTVLPLTPATISVQLASVSLTQLEAGSVQIVARNDGLEDLSDATLELWAAPPNAPATIVVTQTASMLAQATSISTLSWTPRSAGVWNLILMLRQVNGQVISFDPITVTVLAARTVTPEDTIIMSAPIVNLPLAIAILATFTLMSGLAFLTAIRNDSENG